MSKKISLFTFVGVLLIAASSVLAETETVHERSDPE